MAGLISEEAFREMIRMMDKDGDGTVDESEFKSVYMALKPETTPEEFTALWAKIDDDGSGELSVEELATYYGFSLDGSSGDGTANEMTDEQILEALALNAKIAEMSVVAPKKEEEKVKKQNEVKRDPTVTLVNTEKKTPDTELSIKLMEAFMLSQLQDDDEGDDVMTYLSKAPRVRFATEKGDTPLHALARVDLKRGRNQVEFKNVFTTLIGLYRKDCEKEKRPLYSDVNYQNKDGKTPLMVAIESKNIKMMDQLFLLDKDGPDTLLVNSVGQTVLHVATYAACNPDPSVKPDLTVLEHLFRHFTAARKRVLLDSPDRAGREALHVAAYRDGSEDSAVSAYLIDKGAKNVTKDSAGNTASSLADRSGRRRSKDIIEQKTGTGPPANSGRRKSRDSKEMPPAPDA